MSKFGGWNVSVPRDKLPQKIASEMSEFVTEPRFGAEYEFKAYLGTQEVNGVNHALLMEQTIFSGKDTVNAVVVTFNEKAGSKDISLVGIRPIVEAGGKLGGTKVAITAEIPQEVKDAFNTALNGFTGSTVVPFAYIGEKMARGLEYKLIAEVTPTVPSGEPHLSIVTVNTLENKLFFENVFERSTAEELALTGNKA